MERRIGRFRWLTSLTIFAFALTFQAAVPADSRAQFSGYWTGLDRQQVFPSGRRAAAFAHDSHRNRLLVFGGYNGGQQPYLNDGWALDLVTEQWHSLPPAPPELSARYGPTAVHDAANDRLLVFGGYDGIQQRNDVWQLPLSGPQVWTRLVPDGEAPTGRSFHVAVYDATNRRMIVFGGYNGDGDSNEFLGDTWQLTLSGHPAWSRLEFMQPTPAPRNLAGATVDVLRNRLVLFGGWNGIFLNDVWTLPLSGTAEWSPIGASSPPSPRREVSIAYDGANDRIVTFGGNDGTRLGDMWALPLSGAPQWQALDTATPPPPRYGHSTVYDAVSGRVVLFAGLDALPADGQHSRTVWAYEKDSETWTELAISDRARTRVRNYSLIRDPVSSLLLMFGGETPRLSNGLHSFNPVTAAWGTVKPESPSSIPTPRYAHRAVWDAARDRMLVFGGYDGAFRNDLWEFRPRPVPVWTELHPGGPLPPPRFAGGLVLDAERDRLIAFGGYRTITNPTPPPTDVPVVMNDLWALPLSGPGALTWQALEPAGTAPTARWGHVMVLDGPRDRVLVFGGGETSDSALGDLYSLNLASDPPMWNLLVSQDSPPGRVIHAGVIDPDRDALVIFGGFGGNPPTFLDDVWIYPLAGLPWTEMSDTSPRPSARDAIQAAYDPVGRRIIVPAGWGSAGYPSDTWALAWHQPVPAQASLVEAHATPDRVRLVWFVRDSDGTVVTVWRRDSAGEWQSRGDIVRDDANRATFEDRNVTPGVTYSYRLEFRGRVATAFGGEVAVTVPSAHRLELAGARPNPTTSEALEVAFSLSRRGTARLELLDVAGRRMAWRDLGELGAGSHRASFQRESLAPGLYVIRFAAEQRVLTARVMVIR